MTDSHTIVVLMAWFPPLRQRTRYRGSSLLASCWLRLAQVAVAVALLWGLTGWALAWWS